MFFTAKDYITASFLSSVLLSIYIASFVIMQPYKDAMYNKTDIPMLVALLIINISLTVDLLGSGFTVKPLSVVCIAVFVFVPLLYLIIWAYVFISSIISLFVNVVAGQAQLKLTDFCHIHDSILY